MSTKEYKAPLCLVTVEEATKVADVFFHDKTPYQPMFVLLYSQPGAGKNFLSERFIQDQNLDPANIIFLSVDAIVEQFAGFRSERKRVDSDTSLSLEERRAARRDVYQRYRSSAGDAIFARILDRALLNRYTIMYETTGANITSTPWQLHRASQLGYITAVLYPFVDLKVSLERVLSRETQSGQVAATAEFIEKAFHLAQINLIRLAPDLDEIYLYDNSGSPPELIFEYRKRYAFNGKTIVGRCTHCTSHVFEFMDPPLRKWIGSLCPHCGASLPVSSDTSRARSYSGSYASRETPRV